MNKPNEYEHKPHEYSENTTKQSIIIKHKYKIALISTFILCVLVVSICTPILVKKNEYISTKQPMSSSIITSTASFTISSATPSPSLISCQDKICTGKIQADLNQCANQGQCSIYNSSDLYFECNGKCTNATFYIYDSTNCTSFLNNYILGSTIIPKKQIMLSEQSYSGILYC